jgi:nucleoside-diphosphate-sugar epimerase
MNTTSLIIGCGYIGEALASELSRAGGQVMFTARSPQRIAALEAKLALRGMVFDTGDVDGAFPSLELTGVEALEVYCLLTPAALGTAEARARLLKWLAQLPVRRAILTSSTGIYGARGGRTVTADSPVFPATEREQRLQTVEQAWLSAPVHCVVRLAGLYGPDRVIGMRMVREGAVIPGNPAALLNLIHRADVIALLTARMHASHAADIEVGSDGNPVKRATYYGFLAELLGTPPPEFELCADAAADQGKAVDSAATMRRLGWRPRYPSFREGLSEALGRATGG